MYEKTNDFIVGMVTAHDKGYMLVFTTLVHTYIFLWEPIVHDHSGSKQGGTDIKNQGNTMYSTVPKVLVDDRGITSFFKFLSKWKDLLL